MMDYQRLAPNRAVQVENNIRAEEIELVVQPSSSEEPSSPSSPPSVSPDSPGQEEGAVEIEQRIPLPEIPAFYGPVPRFDHLAAAITFATIFPLAAIAFAAAAISGEHLGYAYTVLIILFMITVLNQRWTRGDLAALGLQTFSLCWFLMIIVILLTTEGPSSLKSTPLKTAVIFFHSLPAIFSLPSLIECCMAPRDFIRFCSIWSRYVLPCTAVVPTFIAFLWAHGQIVGGGRGEWTLQWWTVGFNTAWILFDPLAIWLSQRMADEKSAGRRERYGPWSRFAAFATIYLSGFRTFMNIFLLAYCISHDKYGYTAGTRDPVAAPIIVVLGVYNAVWMPLSVALAGAYTRHMAALPPFFL
jgi:hypothetical protein